MQKNEKIKLETQIKKLTKVLQEEELRIARNHMQYSRDNKVSSTTTKIVKDNFEVITNSPWDLDPELILIMDQIQVLFNSDTNIINDSYQARGLIGEKVDGLYSAIKNLSIAEANNGEVNVLRSIFRRNMLELINICVKSLFYLDRIHK